jgi:hypothetical protein
MVKNAAFFVNRKIWLAGMRMGGAAFFADS